MENNRQLVFMVIFIFTSISLFSWTADGRAVLKEGRSSAFSVAPLVSVIMGYSNELVFDESSSPHPYLSRLHWQVLPAVIAGLKGSYNYKNRILFNAALGTALNKNTGQMINRDWISNYFDSVDTDWTHESVSDIYLKSSFLFDSSLAYGFYNRKNWKFNGLLGYKHIYWDWTDSIVSINYPGQNLDSLIGVNGIDYSIKYNIPYLGLSSYWSTKRFSGGITVSYSFLTSIKDHDFHKLRDLHFYDSFSMGQYLGLSTNVRWLWKEPFLLSAALDMDWVPELKGDVEIYNTSGSFLGYYTDGAGVSYFTMSVSLALEYHY